MVSFNPLPWTQQPGGLTGWSSLYSYLSLPEHPWASIDKLCSCLCIPFAGLCQEPPFLPFYFAMGFPLPGNVMCLLPTTLPWSYSPAEKQPCGCVINTLSAVVTWILKPHSVHQARTEILSLWDDVPFDTMPFWQKKVVSLVTWWLSVSALCWNAPCYLWPRTKIRLFYM